MEPLLMDANTLVIVDEDQAAAPPQPRPTRREVIPALERHIMATDLKTPEHVTTYSISSGGGGGKRGNHQVTMVTEDLSRVSARNEGIVITRIVRV